MNTHKTITVLFAIAFILFTACNKDQSTSDNESSELITFRVGLGDYNTKSTNSELTFDFSAYDELEGYDVYFSNIVNPETGELGSYTFENVTIGDDLEITTNQPHIHCKVNHPNLVDSVNTSLGYLKHDSQLMIPNEENGVIVIKMDRAQAGAVIFIAEGTHSRVNDIQINAISVNEEEPLFTTNSYFRFSYRDEFGIYVETQVNAPKKHTFIGNLVAKDNGTGIVWEIEEYDDANIIDL